MRLYFAAGVLALCILQNARGQDGDGDGPPPPPPEAAWTPPPPVAKCGNYLNGIAQKFGVSSTQDSTPTSSPTPSPAPSNTPSNTTSSTNSTRRSGGNNDNDQECRSMYKAYLCQTIEQEKKSGGATTTTRASACDIAQACKAVMPTSRFIENGQQERPWQWENKENEGIADGQCRTYTNKDKSTVIRIYCSKTTPTWAKTGNGAMPDSVKNACVDFKAPAAAGAAKLSSGSALLLTVGAVMANFMH